MKRKGFITAAAVLAAILMPVIASAQGYMGIPNLTEDQKTKIGELRTKHMKEVQQLKNQVAENRAHYKTLMTADKPDMDAINKNIDELSKMRGEMMKKNAAHQQSIRALLNDEQRLFFDAHRGGKRMRGMGMGPGNGMGRDGMNGKGRGYRGNGPGPFCPMNTGTK